MSGWQQEEDGQYQKRTPDGGYLTVSHNPDVMGWNWDVWVKDADKDAKARGAGGGIPDTGFRRVAHNWENTVQLAKEKAEESYGSYLESAAKPPQKAVRPRKKAGGTPTQPPAFSDNQGAPA